MNPPVTKYQSFLLRLWQDNPQIPWRASLQNLQTNDLTHFADMDALVAFLWTQTTRPPSSEGAAELKGFSPSVETSDAAGSSEDDT